MEKMSEQIKKTYKKAFFDLLEESVASEPPDYDWLIRLYTEIRDKLCALTSKTSVMRRDMMEKLDPDFFSQLIRNKVFDGKSMYGLVWFTFEKCLELGSPGRDTETKKARDEVISLMGNSKAKFSDIVPLYIKNVNECIDKIYEDLRVFMTQVRQPVAKN